MSEKRRSLTRRDYLKLIVMVIGTAAGTVSILVGAASIGTHPGHSYLLFGAGELGYGITGMAAVSLPIRISWLPPAATKASWLGLPRLALIIGAFGLLGAITNTAQALTIGL